MINTRELSIIGTRMSCNQFQPTIERFARHEFQLDGMVSHYIPFDQVDQVFENIIPPPKDRRRWSFSLMESEPPPYLTVQPTR